MATGYVDGERWKTLTQLSFTGHTVLPIMYRASWVRFSVFTIGLQTVKHIQRITGNVIKTMKAEAEGEAVYAALSAVETAVRSITLSSKLSAELANEIQLYNMNLAEDDQIKFSGLIKRNATRWTSLFCMVERFNKLANFVGIIAERHDGKLGTGFL